MESWAEQFGGDQWATEFARATGSAAGTAGPRTRQEGYQFAADNPYMDDTDSFAKVRSKVLNHLNEHTPGKPPGRRGDSGISGGGAKSTVCVC